ncbi:amino acid ABC transporter permease [Micromonospora endophytica]|uniref:Amino acid ABC transporter permease n=1 Tax=Micromonospora endophytica TaxID=515350 RepID=A0A2W2CA30_9ACTN|nr:amino acid ABC transporter permease [Micromonospora endophytica]PZF95442.1 amino acid ABC transporter permease [Micromonospora endophytica]RIW50392.1 amino acid ABC transporter permease [Micromonospora endophytica]BCJ57804.1 glutamate ABC transporter permease [Micromonospora endophytica]
MSTSSVLYDHPGPRARIRNTVLSVVFGVALLGLVYWIYTKFDQAGQWEGWLWKPFTDSKTWTEFILPGLWATLKAAAVGMLLSLAFGIIFAVGRLSDHKWISIPSGAVVEFFRAVPLLLMIFFVFYGLPYVIKQPVTAFWAVVIGLTLYNGSVLAEAFRAGIRSVPGGQSEAAYAIGMRKSQVMQLILIPQAARAMLPIIVSQLVVLLKDTALGYIVAYPELLQRGVNDLSANYGNIIPAAMVMAVIYIIINSMLTWFAGWLDRRSRVRAFRVPKQTTPAGAVDSTPEGGATVAEPQG